MPDVHTADEKKLLGNPMYCPRCGAELEREPPEIEGRKVTRGVDCPRCFGSWDLIYKLTTVITRGSADSAGDRR